MGSDGPWDGAVPLLRSGEERVGRPPVRLVLAAYASDVRGMTPRRFLPLLAIAALAAAPAASSASDRVVDDAVEEVVDDTPAAGEDALEDDAPSPSDEDEAEEPAVVDVVVTLRDGTVAGSGHHVWTDDQQDLPTGYTLNSAGRKATKRGRTKLRLKATVRYADGTTEVVRETLWVGKAPARAKKRTTKRT